jgi:hypothetical protein
MRNNKNHVYMIDEIPEPDDVRAEIREYVKRAGVLQQLLRVAVREAERRRAGREEVPHGESR